MTSRLLLVASVAAVVTLGGCNREERELRPSPAASQVVNQAQVSGLNPGAKTLPTPPKPAVTRSLPPAEIIRLLLADSGQSDARRHCHWVGIILLWRSDAHHGFD